MKIISTYEYNEIQKKLKDAEKTSDHYKNMKNTLREAQNKLKVIESEHRKDIKSLEDKYEINEKKAVTAMEDKISKLKNELEKSHQEKIHALKTELYEEKTQELEKMMKGNYEKLSKSMTKLHEEGNAQTKHMNEITKEIIKATGLGAAKVEVQQIEHVNG